MDKSTDQNASNSLRRIKLGATLGYCDGRTIGSQKTGAPPKIILDSSKILGDPVEGRTVGGKKSGLTGKVHFDPSKMVGNSADDKTVGSAKSDTISK